MANNKLHIAGIEPDGLVKAAIDGSITGADTRPGGINLIEALLGANWRASRVMLDFIRCSYIDSAAVGWLVDSNKQLKEGGGMLVLHSIPPRVRQILEILRLHKVLNLAANEAAAAAMIRSGAAAGAGPESKEAGQ